ncbi:MAG: BolA family transcriptional regulator [Pseudomonadota bacterium]|nr:BolA family transcriptional regulator [Pseudomonadota bacterium]
MQDPKQSRAARLEAALARGFAPTLLRVADDSARHAGHAGAQPGGQTHYTVLLVSAAFRDLNRIARARAVHAVLETEFAGGMHALSLTLRTPEEQASLSQAGDQAGAE